ncbi:MAG: hypothetical protein R3C14_26450 [Caldilineaceae bacterium]
MNQREMKKRVREARKTLKQQWDKLSQSDLDTIEKTLDRMVNLFQERYGYSNEHAIKEVENYVQAYSERARDTLQEQFEQIRKEPRRALPLAWIILVAVSAVLLLVRLRGQNHNE